MFLQFGASILARSLLLCLVTSGAVFPAHAAELMAWRDARNILELIVHLELWLDESTSLPRNERDTNIRWIDRYSAATLPESQHAAYGGDPRGRYDPDSDTIWLVHPWDPRDPRDVSVLLHELIHHRQAVAGHWYCPGAQELPAYRTQQAWLAELGLEINVNWIAVVLESGCTPRDFHPD